MYYTLFYQTVMPFGAIWTLGHLLLRYWIDKVSILILKSSIDIFSIVEICQN